MGLPPRCGSSGTHLQGDTDPRARLFKVSLLLVFIKYFVFCVREHCLVIFNISIYLSYVLKSSGLQTLFPLAFVKFVFASGQIFQNNLS